MGSKGLPPKAITASGLYFLLIESGLSHFAVDQGIHWREDASNASVKYQRNLIRHQVIPLLEKINPDLVNSFSESAMKIAAAESMVTSSLAAIRQKLVKKRGEDFFIDKKKLSELPEGSFVLFEMLKAFGFNFSQACDIYEKSDSTGKRFLSKNYQLNIDREALIISPVTPGPSAEMYIDAGMQTVHNDDFVLSLRQVAAKGFFHSQ